jgi:hypothetical protein
MSEVRDKMLEAGIVPKNAVGQMEQWQSMPAGSAEKVGEADLQKVQALREEMELKALPVLHETMLDIDKIMKAGHDVTLTHEPLKVTCWCGVDRLGRYVFAIPQTQDLYNTLSVMMRPLTIMDDPHQRPPRDIRRITAVSVLYKTIEVGKTKKSVPTHWFCMTEAEGEDHVIKGVRHA